MVERIPKKTPKDIAINIEERAKTAVLGIVSNKISDIGLPLF